MNSRPGIAPRKRRLSAHAGLRCLAREMWLRRHGEPVEDNPWDADALVSTVYERYFEMAELAIREEMERAE